MEKELLFEGKLIRNIFVNKELWYCAKDICSILHINNTSQALVGIPDDNIKINKIKTKGGIQKLNMINIVGIKEILIKTRSESIALNLAKYLEIDLSSLRKTIKEDYYITQLSIVFNHEKYIKQYYCKGYKIDLYFPEYKIGIECDENNHKNYNKIKEKIREDIITKELNCKIIRFNPDEKDFNIFEIINKILVCIKHK
jgi:very-short-patch-repair endonuclease